MIYPQKPVPGGTRKRAVSSPKTCILRLTLAALFHPGTRRQQFSFTAGDANLYRYVFNMPTVFTDPSGQIVWLPVLLFGGAILIGTTAVAVNTSLPEKMGEWLPETFAGPNNDFLGRWADRVEERNVAAYVDRYIGVGDGMVESGTAFSACRYKSPSFGQPGHTSTIWQYPVRHWSITWRRGAMWLGRIFLVAFIIEGVADAVVVIESAIETALDQ